MKKIIINIFPIIGVLIILYGIFWLITSIPFDSFHIFQWEYEELARVASPDGQYEIVPFQGNAGAVSGYAYDLFVVPKGKSVDRENDSQYCVFVGYEDTELKSYKWQDDTVEIQVGEGGIEHYTTFYGIREGFRFKKVGDVTLEVIK
ncbi:MAG: DUF5412 family protein [Planctomycetota bacterium]|jgi:hypothetical protein